MIHCVETDKGVDDIRHARAVGSEMIRPLRFWGKVWRIRNDPAASFLGGRGIRRCERSEAIQSAVPLDCFAPLATTSKI
jgi:hypothetical protein